MNNLEAKLCVFHGGTGIMSVPVRYFFMVALSLVSGLALMLNLSAIVQIVRQKKFQKNLQMAHVFVFIAGLIWGCLFGPSMVAEMALSHRSTGIANCTSRAVSAYLAACAIGFSIVGIAQVGTIKAIKLRRRFSKQPGKLMWTVAITGAMWLVVCFVPVILVFAPGQAPKRIAMAVAVFVAVALLQLFLSYSFVLKEIYTSLNRLKLHAAKSNFELHRRASRKILIILSSFALSYCPLFIAVILLIVQFQNSEHTGQRTLFLQVFMITSLLLTGLHAALNPLLYYGVNTSSFPEAIWRLIRFQEIKGDASVDNASSSHHEQVSITSRGKHGHVLRS